MDLPSSFTKASCIWEVGGTGVGSFFGISKQNGNYFLRIRAGTGTVGLNDPTTVLPLHKYLYHLYHNISMETLTLLFGI